MSEVEKLYKNAHIEKVINHECTYDYGITCPNDNDTCDNCGYYKEKEPDYPPFTAKKQLELIKWLARFNVRIEYTEYAYAKYFIESHRHGYSVYTACFEQALAELINTLWQDLTEEERKQIRSILNG